MFSCPGNAIRLASGGEPPVPLEAHLVDDLVFLLDLDLLGIDIDLTLFGREHDSAVEPDAFDLVSVRVVVMEVLDRAELPPSFLEAGNPVVDLPGAFGRVGPRGLVPARTR